MQFFLYFCSINSNRPSNSKVVGRKVLIFIWKQSIVEFDNHSHSYSSFQLKMRPINGAIRNLPSTDLIYLMQFERINDIHTIRFIRNQRHFISQSIKNPKAFLNAASIYTKSLLRLSLKDTNPTSTPNSKMLNIPHYSTFNIFFAYYKPCYAGMTQFPTFFLFILWSPLNNDPPYVLTNYVWKTDILIKTRTQLIQLRCSHLELHTLLLGPCFMLCNITRSWSFYPTEYEFICIH